MSYFVIITYVKIKYNNKDIALNGYLICTYGAVALISVWPIKRHTHKMVSQVIIAAIIFIILLFFLPYLHCLQRELYRHHYRYSY